MFTGQLYRMGLGNDTMSEPSYGLPFEKLYVPVKNLNSGDFKSLKNPNRFYRLLHTIVMALSSGNITVGMCNVFMLVDRREPLHKHFIIPP